jgi:S1-C subfamily serine protease
MEDLTKTQIVLLSILVSFVTSIGTGIITSSLLNNASAGVSQTINRVVERTIEKVVPSPGGGTVKETTVVVKEEDLIMSAVGKIGPSVVRIKNLPSSDSQETLQSLGLVVSKNGLIVADKKYFIQGQNYNVKTSDGTVLPASVVAVDDKNSIAFLKADNSGSKYSFVPASLGDSDKLKLGQTIVSIGGQSNNSVSIGNISDLSYADESAASSTSGNRRVTSIESQIILKDNVVGGPLLNVDGDIVGIKLSQLDSTKNGVYLPVNLLKDEITSYSK